MGKVLNIRVMAQTLNEDEVAKVWPRLVLLAWPEWMAKLGLERIADKLPGYSAGISPVEKALGLRTHGVMELAEALPDLLKFGDLAANITAALEEPVALVEKLKGELDSALADWDTKTASALSFKLEDALTDAERSLDKA